MSVWDDVDTYVSELFVGDDLAFVLAASDAAGLPSIHVSPPQGKMLYLLARMMGARRVLEIGTLAGYSTIWMARAVGAGGSVVTLEYEPKHAEVAQSNIERAGLSDVVDVRVGAALDLLPDVKGPFDLIFIDADKETYPVYFAWSLELSRVGTLIIGDNVVRDGEVINPATSDIRVQGVRRFNEMLAASPRVEATAIQTVGVKGYDGFAMALVVA